MTLESELWANLQEFLNEIVPVCEECNINLALHPDDPPVKKLANGQPQIIYDIEQIEKVCNLVPSPRNGVCFCQGTFASRGINIPSAIRKLGEKNKICSCA